MAEEQQAGSSATKLQRLMFSNDSEASNELLWSGDILASELELLNLLGAATRTGTGQAQNESPSLLDSGSYAFESGPNVTSQSQLLLDALLSARQSAPAAPLRHDSSDFIEMPALRGWNPQPQQPQPHMQSRPQVPYPAPNQAQWQQPQQVEFPPMLSAGFLSQQGHHHASSSYSSHQQGGRQTYSQHQGPPLRYPGAYSNSSSGTNAVPYPNHGHHHRGGGGGGQGGGQGGGGYRKLWAQVNKVSKGGKLDEGDTSRPFSVEDLIHIVLTLPPGEPAVPVIAAGLPYLDSSAFAAMLKELNKQGQQHRCNEIFDWLRGLPPSNELYRLCDIFTYTTMISQCGSQQYLRRGLELVAEMKGRGITLNVHTYSALMNVCVKANELDLARDVFSQMRDEGCQPNLVTYNILIDVHVKKGSWQEAVNVLDSLEQENILIEARTYNTILSACNKCGLPEEALKVYRRMIAAGVSPTATTFTGLITAYGKTGRIDQAMEVYRDMSMRGCERNVITYSSLISAAEKAGRLDIALELLKTMQKEGIRPNTITYNSLLAACCHGGNWEMAQHLFDQMQQEGNRPDVITFAALINAFERGHQWRLALTALDIMQNFGLHPDANIFNSLLDVLWQSGIALAQARALQLWSMANRTGLFRIYISKTSETSSQLQYTALALSGGALCVTLLRWIGEMKSRLAREGVSFLRTSVSLLMYRSKSSSGPYVRSASSQLQEAQGPEGEASAANSLQPSALDPFSSSMLETFSSMLAGASSPFTLSLASSNQNDYEASHIGNLGNPFLMIEAQSSLLAPWLSSIDCSNLLLLAAQGGSIQLRKSHESALNDDMTLAMRSREAFETALRLELSQPINMQSYSPQVMSQRIQVVGTAIKICASLSFGQDAVYDSLLRFDRCLSTLGASFDHFSWPLLLSACILHSGIQADALTRMILAITGGREDQVRMNLSPQTRDLISNIIQHPVEAMVQMERRVVDILGQESLGNFSTLKFVELFLQRIGMDVHLGGEGSSSSIVARLTSDIHVLLTKAACSTAMMSFRPSLVASAALIVARKKHGAVPFWPGALQLMTGYALTDPKLNKETDLSACFACLSSLGDN